MGKRTPEQFLAEEGMTIETAKRIYNNTLNSRIRLYGMSLEEALTKPKQTNEEKVRPRLEKRYK